LKGKDPFARRHAAAALGKIAEPLIVALKDKDHLSEVGLQMSSEV